MSGYSYDSDDPVGGSRGDVGGNGRTRGGPNPRGPTRSSESDQDKSEGGDRSSGDGTTGSNNGSGSKSHDRTGRSRKHEHTDDEDPLDNEYYSFLNVSRTATQEEITAAYKKLSRIYHPDKHVEEDKKRQAELMFAKLKSAYEVLNDPHKRAIYDCLGKKGLEERGWEIVQRTRTPQEIREEYERLAKERAEARLHQRTNPTSRLQMGINATEFFDQSNYNPRHTPAVVIPSVRVSEISFNQSIEAPITNSDKVILAGNVSTRNGSGEGSISATFHRLASEKSWYQFTSSFGNGLSMGSTVYRKLSPRTFADMSGSLQFSPDGFKPSFSTTMGSNLTTKTRGYLTYSTNWLANLYTNEGDLEWVLDQEESGMSTMIVREGERFRFSFSIQFGIPYTYCNASVVRKFDPPLPPNQNGALAKKKPSNVQLRAALKCGTFGALVEYGIDRRLSAHSTIGATMVVGIPFGVKLRVRFSRFTQTYIFPLQLTDGEIMMQPIFYGTVAPLLAWFTFKKLILDPYDASKRLAEKEKLRDANLVRVALARKEAQASVDLMKERFNRIRQEELHKGGLVILLALYGSIVEDTTEEVLIDVDEVLPRGSGQGEDYTPVRLDQNVVGSEVIDVTVPVQCQVDAGSRLTFYEDSATKSELAGFYDPCALLADESKHLLIRYLYQGQLHQVVIGDEEGAKLPKNTHRL